MLQKLQVKVTPIQLSEEGAYWIGNFEGFRAMPYKDGGGLWSIGFGHRIPSPEPYPVGITREQAVAFMKMDVTGVIQALTALKLDLPMQHHQDAVISLIYNIGSGAFGRSIVCEAIRAKATDLYAWAAWIRDAKGVVEPGLVKRREAEMRLFIYGEYLS
jgi:lysozyme